MHNVWPISAPTGQAAVPEALFKHDRPRAIDRYIDYFGDSGRPTTRDVVVDDRLLETPA